MILSAAVGLAGLCMGLVLVVSPRRWFAQFPGNLMLWAMLLYVAAVLVLLERDISETLWPIWLGATLLLSGAGVRMTTKQSSIPELDND